MIAPMCWGGFEGWAALPRGASGDDPGCATTVGRPCRGSGEELAKSWRRLRAPLRWVPVARTDAASDDHVGCCWPLRGEGGQRDAVLGHRLHDVMDDHVGGAAEERDAVSPEPRGAAGDVVV